LPLQAAGRGRKPLTMRGQQKANCSTDLEAVSGNWIAQRDQVILVVKSARVDVGSGCMI
jgi:hypothetical protein